MSHNPNIDKALMPLIPKKLESVLDLGCGYGSLALLLRIQLKYHGILDGLDIYEPWVNMLKQYNIYDKVTVGDVRMLDEVPLEKYDLVVMMETVEHIDRIDGLKLITTLQERCKQVIITTPETETKNINVTHRKDDHFTGNVTMKHKSGYLGKDFTSRGYKVEYVNVHYLPHYFLPLYQIRAKLINSSTVLRNIIAYKLDGSMENPQVGCLP